MLQFFNHDNFGGGFNSSYLLLTEKGVESRLTDITLKRYKVSHAGGGGLRVTIPKLVADTWGLKAGDTLQMVFRDAKELIISKSKDEG